MADSTKSRGLTVVFVLALSLTTVAALGRASQTTSGDSEDEAAAEIRIRALADLATLGVAGAGCNDLLRGSGFVVDGTTYTNRHLVEGGAVVKLDQLIDPVVVPLTAIADDLDVATAPGVDAVSLRFAVSNPAVGDSVFVAGHAGGGETVVLAGVVHLYGAGADWGVEGNVMLIDVATEPGFSGGPVLDVDGAVVGMLQGFEPTIGLTLAIPVEDLRSWVPADPQATTGRCRG